MPHRRAGSKSMVRSEPPPADGWVRVSAPLQGVGSQSDKGPVNNRGESPATEDMPWGGTRSQREADTNSTPRGGWRQRREQPS